MNILHHHILQQISSDSLNSYNNAKINRVNKTYVLLNYIQTYSTRGDNVPINVIYFLFQKDYFTAS